MKQAEVTTTKENAYVARKEFAYTNVDQLTLLRIRDVMKARTFADSEMESEEDQVGLHRYPLQTILSTLGISNRTKYLHKSKTV